jgi:hypothetical protein
MACSRRGSHDKNPTVVDLKAGMITSIRQRLNIIGRPRPGMFCQRDAHDLTSRRSSSLASTQAQRNAPARAPCRPADGTTQASPY